MVLTLATLLTSCAVKPPEPVNWDTPVQQPESSLVDPQSYLLRDPLLSANDPTLPMVNFLELIKTSAFCDGDPNHTCEGDLHNGWRGLYNGQDLVMMSFFTLGTQLDIEVVGDEYYLSCGGYGGKRKQVSQTFPDDLKNQINRVREAEKEYKNANQDTASGIGGAIIGGLVGCGGGFLIAGPPGCGVGGVMGAVGGIAGAWWTGSRGTTRAAQELESAQEGLRRFHNECPK